MNDMQQYLVDEYAEDYQLGRLSRRDALKVIAAITGSVVLANSVLAACAPPLPSGAEVPPTELASAAAASATVSPEDASINASSVKFPAADAELFGYLARPAGDGVLPVVLVCHENSGLTPHIQDVTRRFAQAGYVALAVDLVSRSGGTEAVGSDSVSGELGGIPTQQFVDDFISGWHYLQEQTFAQAERVGMVGFCFGGGVTWRVAAGMPELLAAVPFYGPAPLASDVPKIQAAVLAIYGENDTRMYLRRSRHRSSHARKQQDLREGDLPRRATTGSSTTHASATTPKPRRTPGAAPWSGSQSICSSHLIKRHRHCEEGEARQSESSVR